MQIIFDTDKDDAKAAQLFVDALCAVYLLKPRIAPPTTMPDERDAPTQGVEETDAALDVDTTGPEAPPIPAADAPRDAAGVAWDARVHTSNQATKQDGTWKRKPGLDDEFYESVMAELTAKADTPAADTPAADTPAADTPAADTPAAAAFAPPPPPVEADDDTPAHSFLSNMQMITRKQLGKAAVDAELAKAGVEGIAGLVAASNEKQAEVAALLEAL